MKQKTTRVMCKCLSLLLAVTTLLTTSGIPVQAEAAEPGTVTQEASPANPVHHCTPDNDSTDITDWSYVYFGSYPQTEVTGNALTAAITEASYDSFGDAWVDGVKYRRLRKNDVDNNDDSYSDSSAFPWKDDNGYHYFKWERIKWRVLQNDGSTLFVMADKGLDCKQYNQTTDFIGWKPSILRNWLNRTFYGTAFSSGEQGAIVSWDVVNDDNPEYIGWEGGGDTNDKVYLLSLDEVSNESYGFCSTYISRSPDRQLKPSDYAYASGALTCTDSDYTGNCYWLLRSIGCGSGRAANVRYDGYINSDGFYFDNGYTTVVPVLHIDLASNLWSLTDDGGSGEGGQGNVPPNPPVHYCKTKNDGTGNAIWSYVYFGSYPQTEVTGDALTAAITGASYDSNGDALVDGVKYRRLRKSDVDNDDSGSDSSAFPWNSDNGYHYFKWERIKWRVLENDGSTLFVVADKGLDYKQYHETGGDITWEECTLRNWLNSSFCDTAFSSQEQEAIINWDVVNDDNPEYFRGIGGNDTNDKVYLLSFDEVSNKSYGFCRVFVPCSPGRQLKPSDYAYASGALPHTGSNYMGNCYWWLRSPGQGEDWAADVRYDGYVDSGGYGVNAYNAVVPALHIDLSSGLWSLTDDGSSGDEGSGLSPANPVHHCMPYNGSRDTTDWSYVYFGSYPQTEVTGDALTAAITEASYDSNGDAWVDGKKYRRLKKSDANNSYENNGKIWFEGYYWGVNNENNDGYHYFMWERIRWRVLQNDGSTLFVVADKGLDCKDYDEEYNGEYNEEETSIPWEDCTLRSWLNSSFYSTAFSSAEQGAIVSQDIVNEGRPEYGIEDGDNTNDKIYLLSLGEATDASYGFCEIYDGQSESREFEASDYTHARGAWKDIKDESSPGGKNTCYWWLRSPGDRADFVVGIELDGYISVYGHRADNDDKAVVPALHIDLSSGLWSLTDDGSSGESGDNGTNENKNQDIIDRVSEYTSDELYAQYEKIADSDYSYDTKNQMYQSLFQSYGVTDVREGIRYLSNTTDKRYAYLALTTDELYYAGNFKYWLENTEKGKEAREVLLADGLIYNNEINDFLDFTTYPETDYPGVAKYKAMLYDFMEASSDSIEIAGNIKLVSDMADKAAGAAKLKADNLIGQLNSCSTAAEAEEVMNSSVAMEVWDELAGVKDKSGNFVRDNNGSIEVTYKLDEASGFGQFSKAMGQETKGISIANMALSDVVNLLTLDGKLAVYAQYRSFLQDIASDTDGLPFQMRWAAALILTELEDSYISKIKDIAWDILDQTSLNSVVLEQIIEEKAAGNLSSWLSAIGIEAFFINRIADIGETVKKESAVEGYASLSSAFTRKLERSKQAFLEDKTESNAWDFYYNYNILYQLREKGEEAYLSMTKVKGFLSCFNDFGYAAKEAVANDTLQMLESRCRFTLDAAQPIPESCQFASKSIINCPVNVSVYAEDGTLIAELLDGVELDDTNAYGRFVVVRDSYSGDYAKVICLNSEENVSFKITGTDNGLVSMEYAQAKDEEDNVYAFDSVPIDKDAVINTTIQGITEQNTYGVDADGDGEVEEYGTITVKPEAYVPIASVKLSETALELKAGESSVLKVTVTPTNATNQKVLWMSADPSVATVADGKVTAVAEGVTTIYCMVLDDIDKMISCEVIVSSDMECAHQNTEVRDQLTATCGAEGYTGDTYCRDCNTKLETGQVIAATGKHTWDEGKAIKSPTCTEKGEKEYTCTVCEETKTEEIEAKGHQNTEMRNQHAATCGAEGYTGDTYCRDCSTKLETGQAIAATGEHTYETAVTKATTAKNGSIIEKCAACGDIKSNKAISSVKSAALKSSSYTYNGKAKKPSVTVKDASGKTISNGNYTVAYKDNVKVGKATVTIRLKGNYEGTLTRTFTICPKGTSISGKITAKSKGFTVKWKKQSKSTTGYQLQISTNNKFAKKATMIKTVKKNSATKLTVKKLKPKKKYYVRVRTYQTVKGKKYYSAWSKSKTVTTRK